jgi:predicted O-methyltransferase YrrM
MFANQNHRRDFADTRALAEFNDYVASDTRVNCVMLTVRDGLTLVRRHS